MGSERIKIEKFIDDCGNGWCNDPGVCKGHIIKYQYNSIVDYSFIEVDDIKITAPDNIIDAIAEIIVEGNGGIIIYDENKNK